jgi:transposase, IS30 family
MARQLTLEERYQIYALRKAGYNQSEIAAELGRHPSTISRELHRNAGRRGYRPRQAQATAQARRQRRVGRRIKPVTWLLVEALLRQDWSPEQVSGWLKSAQRIHVSHEWVYQHIYRDKARGGDLWHHLRCQKRRRKRYGRYGRRGQIPGRVSIEERPALVETRGRLGDWELDTIIGRAPRRAIVSMVERKSKYTLLAQVERPTAAAVGEALKQQLQPYREKVRTLTADNGREFACHQEVAQCLDAAFYFAHPYHSWERGLNENTNGLVRQYFPKRSDFSQITGADLQRAVAQLNHRPRKTLNYKTPHQVFFNTNEIAFTT